MRMFDLKGVVLSLSTPSINSMLNSIEMYKGKTSGVDKLEKVELLRNIARRFGAVSSCAVGNVFISTQQEKDLFVRGKPATNFQTHMVLGYAEAIDLIDKNYKFQPMDMKFMSDLHYYMYKGYNPELGGHLKKEQNYIMEAKPDGKFDSIFTPAAPEEAHQLLDSLIYQFNMCAEDEEVNKLLLTAVFLLDFMCIHPYQHANGRLSRLLLHFCLKKFGYKVDDYYAISYLVEKQISDYIAVFKESTQGWEDMQNNYEPYCEFLIKLVLQAYRRLEYIIEINNLDMSTEDKVLKIVQDSATPIGKHVVRNALFGIQKETIDKHLNKLVSAGKIQLIQRGDSVKYFRN